MASYSIYRQPMDYRGQTTNDNIRSSRRLDLINFAISFKYAMIFNDAIFVNFKCKDVARYRSSCNIYRQSLTNVARHHTTLAKVQVVSVTGWSGIISVAGQ